jgi:DNA-binding beta-propeller fold protein YncE
MGTGQDRTHMLYVTPDARKIYTTNVASGTISILTDTLIQPTNGKPRRDWTQTVVTAGHGSEGFDVLPDGKKLWTVASDDGVIYIVDLPSKRLQRKITANAFGANRLKFTPDGKRALISSIRTGDLFIYDVESGKEIKKINVGHSAAGILIAPDGARAFVACSSDNYIAVIDLTTLEIVKRFDVGKVPDGMAWATRP